MTFHTRRQLALLLALTAVAGVGLAVGQWRRARPDLVERVERLDRQPEVAPVGAVPALRRPASPAPGAGPRRPPAREARADAPAPVDLNRATSEELTRLPGIGPALAARIVDTRERDGPFASVDDLRRVRGLGRGKIERVRALVTVAD